MGRWRIERDYLELKQQLGVGRFEGRNFEGRNCRGFFDLGFLNCP
jgi:SRSO17 transposase